MSERTCWNLLSTKAGESSLVVDRNCWTLAAAATTTATVFTTITTIATIATSTTTSTEIATVAAEITTVTTVTTVATIATISTTTTSTELATLATLSTASTAATTSTSVTGLLLEGVVDVEEFLLGGTLSFAFGLFFALEVILGLFLGQLLGRLPLLVLLDAFVGCTGFLEAKSLQLLRCLFGQVLGVGLAGVFWLCFGLRNSFIALGNRDLFGVLVPCFVLVGIPSAFLFFLFGNGLASLFIRPFTVSGLFTPAMALLLRVITSSISIDPTAFGQVLTLRQCGCGGHLRDGDLLGHDQLVVHHQNHARGRVEWCSHLGLLLQ